MKPIKNRVIVKPLNQNETVVNGIIIAPGETQDQINGNVRYGTVIHSGSQEVAEGDVVIYSRMYGVDAGDGMIMLEEEEIMGVV